jgi:hypothetical protein
LQSVQINVFIIIGNESVNDEKNGSYISNISININKIDKEFENGISIEKISIPIDVNSTEIVNINGNLISNLNTVYYENINSISSMTDINLPNKAPNLVKYEIIDDKIEINITKIDDNTIPNDKIDE